MSMNRSGRGATTQQRVRYMDVLTVRPSQGALNRTIAPHTKLLVEPVVLPDMTHLSVDDANEVHESCVFYPTGQKNVNMRRTMEEMVRKVNAKESFSRKATGSLPMAKPIQPYIIDPNMPVQPLCYTRTAKNKHANDEIKYLLSTKLSQERMLRTTVMSEF